MTLHVFSPVGEHKFGSWNIVPAVKLFLCTLVLNQLDHICLRIDTFAKFLQFLQGLRTYILNLDGDDVQVFRKLQYRLKVRELATFKHRDVATGGVSIRIKHMEINIPVDAFLDQHPTQLSTSKYSYLLHRIISSLISLPRSRRRHRFYQPHPYR